MRIMFLIHCFCMHDTFWLKLCISIGGSCRSVGMDAEAFKSLVLGLCAVSASLTDEDRAVSERLAEGIKAFTRTRVTELLRSGRHRPVLRSYANDATSQAMGSILAAAPCLPLVFRPDCLCDHSLDQIGSCQNLIVPSRRFDDCRCCDQIVSIPHARTVAVPKESSQMILVI